MDCAEAVDEHDNDLAEFAAFCAALGRPALADEPRFLTNRDRLAHYTELRPILEAIFVEAPTAHWTATLTDAAVPCGAVRDVATVLADPQLEARDMIERVLRLADKPVRAIMTPPCMQPLTAIPATMVATW